MVAYDTHAEYVFLELDELPALTDATAEHDAGLLGRLLGDALPRLGLAPGQVQHAAFRSHQQIVFLEITAADGWARLPPAKARYYYYHTRLHDEAVQLRRRLPVGALKRPDTTAVTFYVRHQQQALHNLLHHCRHQLEPAQRTQLYAAPQAFDLADIYRLCYAKVEKILGFVEQTFPEHLDLTVPLSYSRRIQALADVQTQLSVVQLVVRQMEDLPDRVGEPLQKCLGQLLIVVQDTGVSYQDLLYPRLLLRVLYERLQRGRSLSSLTLFHLLVRYNFNSIAFFDLITEHIQLEIYAAASTADRLHTVARYLKIYKQLQSSTALAYAQALPPLREQMVNWLKEERDYLRRQPEPLPPPVNLEQLSESARLPTTFSVAQLAFFHRVLHDTGFFRNESQRATFRFISTHYRTPRQEQISEKSVADKYYNVEESTYLAVKEAVGKMMSYLLKNHPSK